MHLHRCRKQHCLSRSRLSRQTHSHNVIPDEEVRTFLDSVQIRKYVISNSYQPITVRRQNLNLFVIYFLHAACFHINTGTTLGRYAYYQSKGIALRRHTLAYARSVISYHISTFLQGTESNWLTILGIYYMCSWGNVQHDIPITALAFNSHAALADFCQLSFGKNNIIVVPASR
ncbi:hypothetical protein SDC9_131168 [bioreactor metagenome]|uniref:Uncharacterized protein n=1 Tax=bioreactor metagenome TaxID=1076179 RepID=A0A645D4I8_9ZZZZ